MYAAKTKNDGKGSKGEVKNKTSITSCREKKLSEKNRDGILNKYSAFSLNVVQKS